MRYEALVQEPEKHIRSICNFLDEEFESGMLTDRSPSTVPPPAGEAPNENLEGWRREHYAKSNAPVTASSLEKWKTRLTREEIAIVEERCKEGMQKHGYNSTSPWPKRLKAHVFSYGYLGLHQLEMRTRKIASTVRRQIRPIRNLRS